MAKDRSGSKPKSEQKVMLKQFRKDRSKRKLFNDTEPLLSPNTLRKTQTSKQANDTSEQPTGKLSFLNPNRKSTGTDSQTLKEHFNRFQSQLLSVDTNCEQVPKSRTRSKSLSSKADQLSTKESKKSKPVKSSYDEYDERDPNSSPKNRRRRGASVPFVLEPNTAPLSSKDNAKLADTRINPRNPNNSGNEKVTNNLKATDTTKSGGVVAKIDNHNVTKQFTKNGESKHNDIPIQNSSIWGSRIWKSSKDNSAKASNQPTVSIESSDFNKVVIATDAQTHLKKPHNVLLVGPDDLANELPKHTLVPTKSLSSSSSDEHSQSTHRSMGDSVCCNQTLLNTIDPLLDENITISINKQSCEMIKVQLDFTGNTDFPASNEEKTAEKKSIITDEGLQVGYVSQLVAQLEDIAAGKKKLPQDVAKSRNDHLIEITQIPHTVKELLSKLESTAVQATTIENPTHPQQVHIPEKQQQHMYTEKSLPSTVEHQNDSSNSANQKSSIVENSSALPTSYGSHPIDLRKEIERLKQENNQQREEIKQLKIERDEANDKVNKMNATNFLLMKESLETKSRLEMKVRDLEKKIKELMNQQ